MMLTLLHVFQMKDRQISMGDKCAICHKKVYLLERHVSEGQLYHRSCFRNSDKDKSPASKIYQKTLIKSESGENNRVQNKTEEPDFWKRRAEAKKAENKTSDHSSSESESSKSSNLKNVPETARDKDTSSWRSSRPSDLKLENQKQDSEGNVMKKDSSIQEQKTTVVTPQPRARRVVQIGGSNENRKEEPMDTSTTNESRNSGLATKSVESTRPKSALQTEPKKEDGKLGVKVQKARRVVQIGKSKDDDSSVSNRTKSPPPVKQVTIPSTPDSPPPLPSSAPPPFKVLTPSSPQASSSPLSPGVLPSPRTTSPPSRPVSSPVGKSESSVPHQKGKTQSALDTKASPSDQMSSSPKALPRNSKLIEQTGAKTSNVISAKSHSDPVANVVSPTQKDDQVLGGLLKNLADIRRKSSSDSSDIKSPLSPTSELKSNLSAIKEDSDNKRNVRSCDISMEKKTDKSAKTKSANFVSGKMSLFSNDNLSSDLSEKNKKSPVKSDDSEKNKNLL